MNGTLNIPPVKCLPGTADSMPHVFVGDEAFPLDYNLMRPYPAEEARNNDEIKIYNYRLSRARRIVECAFGILTQRFDIYSRRIRLEPNQLIKVVLATISLHNFLNKRGRQPRTSHNNASTPNVERALQNLIPIVGNDNNMSAIVVRENFKRYFNTDIGSLTWQYEIPSRRT